MNGATEKSDRVIFLRAFLIWSVIEDDGTVIAEDIADKACQQI